MILSVTDFTTDEEVMAATRGYSVRYAKTAARFRRELIERYGEECGRKIRYAEGYEVCEYGGAMAGEVKEVLESL